MKSLFAIAPLMFLLACETATPPTRTPIAPPTPPAAGDTCNANQYSTLIGQDATALERVLILGEVRIVRPNRPMTMDFRPGRINFVIGADNRITSIRCN